MLVRRSRSCLRSDLHSIPIDGTSLNSQPFCETGAGPLRAVAHRRALTSPTQPKETDVETEARAFHVNLRSRRPEDSPERFFGGWESYLMRSTDNMCSRKRSSALGPD